jgi:hypothetical protein
LSIPPADVDFLTARSTILRTRRQGPPSRSRRCLAGSARTRERRPREERA